MTFVVGRIKMWFQISFIFPFNRVPKPIRRNKLSLGVHYFTFEVGGGPFDGRDGWFGFRYEYFFPKPLEPEYTPRDIFFSVQDIFPSLSGYGQNILFRDPLLTAALGGGGYGHNIIFLYQLLTVALPPPPPLKSQMFGPLTLFWDYFKTLRQNLKTSVRLFQVVVCYTCKPEFFFRLSFRNYISCVYKNCDVLLSRFVSSLIPHSNIWHSYNHPQFQLILQIKFLTFTGVLWVC